MTLVNSSFVPLEMSDAGIVTEFCELEEGLAGVNDPCVSITSTSWKMAHLEDSNAARKTDGKTWCKIKPDSCITYLVLAVKAMIGIIFILGLWLLHQFDCQVTRYSGVVSDNDIGSSGFSFVFNLSMCTSKDNIRNSFTRVPIDITLGLIFSYQTVDQILNKSFSLLVDKKKSWLAVILFGFVNLISTIMSLILIIEIVGENRIGRPIVAFLTVFVVLQILCIPIQKIARCCGYKCDCFDAENVLEYISVALDALISIGEFFIFNSLFCFVLYNETGTFSLVIFDIALLIYWISFDYCMLQLLRSNTYQADSEPKPKSMPCVSCCCTLVCKEYIPYGIILSKYVTFIVVVITLAVSKYRYDDPLVAWGISIGVIVLIGLFTIFQAASYGWSLFKILADRYKKSKERENGFEMLESQYPAATDEESDHDPTTIATTTASSTINIKHS